MSVGIAEKLIASREGLGLELGTTYFNEMEAEGGCGVVGLASSVPLKSRYIMQALKQMHNRGNGKGGGIAAVGLSPEQMGVSKEVLEEDYLIQVAYLDPAVRGKVEADFLKPNFKIDKNEKVPNLEDHREAGLEVKPPEVWRYFCRVDEKVLKKFTKDKGLEGLNKWQVEDEFVFQNSFRLNTKFYAAMGEKKAFVLSHGRNMMVMKVVGYAEQAIKYYKLEDMEAHIWIGHQRYPTKGRVWHPAGAHPFVGLHDALVHNGDFANYYSVSEYLKQRNMYPLFLTDTEVSALLFDLLSRTYEYPLEYIIEALAPTTERDFDMLPEEKKKMYRAIQSCHLRSSPDGPWFFIIGRNVPRTKELQLIGITDTSMLRPQVFALREGEVKIGMVASEKQAIDAALESIASDDNRFSRIADKYWNARGGSHTDGGAFVFTVKGSDLVCEDKFGKRISVEKGDRLPRKDTLDYEAICKDMLDLASTGGDTDKSHAIETLTALLDRRYEIGVEERRYAVETIENSLYEVFSTIPKDSGKYSHVDWKGRDLLTKPADPNQTLIIDVKDFPPEGDECASLFLVRAYKVGWRRFIAYNNRGQRFLGCGLGPVSEEARIDVYGSSGDYLASGLDGAEIYIHGNAQDQLGQILKSGRLVIYGDVGQAFMYGAKGGDVYVLGNAAGRPLINAVGHPRVVINGTCLDYLAESFMAGDPHDGGGFVILNGIQFDGDGKITAQDTPYPGGNLFSLASGGAIYIRDPHHKVGEEQLNGGRFAPLEKEDWDLVLPYLKENERLFGVSVEKHLLTVRGEKMRPEDVYMKIEVAPLAVLGLTSDGG